MARGRKKENLTPEERLQAALVPESEQPYKVPENWCWTRIGTILQLQAGKNIKASAISKIKNNETPFPCFGGNGIRGYVKDYNRDGDFPIIGRQGALCGNLNWASQKFYATEHAVVVECLPNISNRWAYYILHWMNLNQYATATAQPGLSVAVINQVPIALPAFKEQQRIVDRIESLFAKLNEAKQKAQDALDSFETRKAAILHKAFTGELTAQWRKEHGVGMESWDNTTLSKIVIGFKYGTSEKSDYSYKGMPVFRIPNITDDGLSFEDLKFLSHKDISDENQIHENDILIVRSNGSRELVGKSVLVPQLDREYAYASFLIRIQPLESVVPNYLVMYLNSTDARMQMFKKAKSSAGINNINSKELGAILINLPSFSEQAEIVCILDNLLAKEQLAKEAAEGVLEQIDLIKKSILARAFRGELGTNDPGEESAVELLKQVL